MKLALIALALILVACAAPSAMAAPKAEPGDATWHLGLIGVLNEGRANLDIYPCFENGRWARALATARDFNTSIHFAEPRDDFALDTGAMTVKGTLDLLVTPDQWVPLDGQPFEGIVTIDGKLKLAGDGSQYNVSGTYTGTLAGKPVKGKLIGGVGATETGWSDASLSVLANQVPLEGGIDRPMVAVSLGVAGDQVHYGAAGISFRHGAPRTALFEDAALAYDGAAVTGTFTLPWRAIEIGGPTDAVAECELTVTRVQGLVGDKLHITQRLADGSTGETRSAYGRGTAQRGGGTPDPDAPKPLWAHKIDTRPWYVAVPGWEPLTPGEHPRLLFRKADIPGLRKKAETPEGKAILKRLGKLLDGKDGTGLPTHFNQTPSHNHNMSPDHPVGTFTTWHGAGYGLLYVVTGEARYADLARQAVELAFDGKTDRDNRYAWVMPVTDMRAGALLAGVAYAYDFCYDAWPEAFRTRVAKELQNYEKPTASGEAKGDTVSIRELLGRTGYPPSSNHYVSMLGAGVAVLAIQGDPGVDPDRVEDRLADLEACVARILFYGFGDHGWYSEGHHPSRVSSECGLLELLQCYRHAAGRDYVNGRQAERPVDHPAVGHGCGGRRGRHA